MNELKSIPGFKNYVATRSGEIFRVYGNRLRKLKPNIKKSGYAYVTLVTSDGELKCRRVHRVIAETFIPNPLGLPHINHLNEIKTDNRVDNLEWCTAKYNANYGNRISKIVTKVSIAVKAIDPITGKEVARYRSMTEASNSVIGASIPHISNCCLGKRKTSGGYILEVVNE